LTLHEAIRQVLQDAGSPQTASYIRDQIRKRKLYTRRDGEPADLSQICARIRKHPDLFVVHSDTVPFTYGVKEWQEGRSPANGNAAVPSPMPPVRSHAPLAQLERLNYVVDAAWDIFFQQVISGRVPLNREASMQLH